MAPQRFTREEAETLIPRLAEIVLQLQRLKREYDELEEEVGELLVKMRGNGHLVESGLREGQERLAQTASELNTLAEQVQGMGCELKGIDEGLIDFRAERDGREVYLCWRLGEESIEWWHELETGFAGRQPLEAR
jgi:hypothetical protein